MEALNVNVLNAAFAEVERKLMRQFSPASIGYTVIEMRANGMKWKDISKALKLSVSTLRRRVELAKATRKLLDSEPRQVQSKGFRVPRFY